MSLIDHKITVNERVLEYHLPRRNDKYRDGRRAIIRDCIASIRRLRKAPTPTDLHDNPAHTVPNE